MDFTQLESLLAIAKHKNYTKAAAEIHISQSALSQKIIKLEDELGIRIFDRTTRFVTPTAIGEDFISRAEKIIAARDEAIKQVEEYRHIFRGNIRIGAMSLAGSYHFSHLIQEFATEYPNIEIELHDAISRGEILDRLTKSELDVGIANDIDNSRRLFSVTPFIYDELAVVVNESHRFAGRSYVSWNELTQERILTPSSNEMLNNAIDERFRLANIEPNIVMRTSNGMNIFSFVGDGLGVALVSSKVMSVHKETMSVIPLRPVMVRELCLVAKEGNISPAALAFIQFAGKWVKEHYPQRKERD